MGNDPHSISFVDPEVQKCPFAAYDRVRSEHPVYVDPVTGFYVLTGYEAVRKATSDTVNLSSRAGQISIREGSTVADEVRAIYDNEGWMPVHSLVNNDPPDHGRFRTFVERAFSAPRIKTITPKIEVAINELIDGFIADGRAEFMSAFATQLPLLIFCEEFGIPEADRDDFRRWSEVLLAQMDPILPPEKELSLTRQVVEMQRYMMTRVAYYREHPSETLLSDLVKASDDGRMSEAELLSVIQMLVPAGHETTANTLGSALRRLVEEPELQTRLRDDAKLIANFAEEILRIDAPIQGLFRRVVNEIDVEGVTIPVGATVVLSWGAANRDPSKFECPEQVVADRGNARQHLSFGLGAHFCVGSQLARAEITLAIHHILRRLANIRYVDGEASYRPHFFAYGPAELHLGFDVR
jgi:cytochrome P450